MKAIQRAYEEFWRAYDLPIPVSKHLEGEYNTLTELLPLAKNLDTYDELEESERSEKERLFQLSQYFLRWRTYIQIQKLPKE